MPRRVAEARSDQVADERYGAPVPRLDRLPHVAIDTVLSDLRLLIPGVRGCVLGGVDGLLITHNLPEDADPWDLAALAATSFGIGRQVGLRLRQGAFRESTVRSQDGYLSVYMAGPSALLGVIGEDAINVARLHLHAPTAAERLAALLATARDS
ncbi:roadblock/LC7 domain-containing protein [Plantactinospora mayteni]|uniref:roadblock/LC7 domain-containing protein n=1 Tax=Plantactinospora mayteni TaxID=566021 RepID=UPI001943CE60|nr:roadblock/LC7 domain-containing protein [Plantactinospora mayteni]